MLMDADVEVLVTAMAEFEPPQIGQVVLSSTQESILGPLISSLWS